MPKQERGLGKGVGALLSEADLSDFRRPVGYINKSVAYASQNDPEAVKEGEIRIVSVDDIEPNPYQPRVTFDEQQLQELCTSIRTLGLIQPITVRFLQTGKFQIISGERRFRACRMAGMTTIPAYVRTSDDTGMLELAIVENVQRSDLDPIETAMSYRRLMDECHLTQEAMADRIGKGRVTVTNMLRLLRLPAKVQYDVKVGNISIGHAKVLLGLEDKELQEQLCDRIIREALSVRALEMLIRSVVRKEKDNSSGTGSQNSDGSGSENQPLGDSCRRLGTVLSSYFGDKVYIRSRASGKGTVTIHFSSEEQIESLLKALSDK